MCASALSVLPQGVGLTAAPAVDVAVDENEEKLALQRAITLVTMRAQTLAADGDAPSPCISVCRMSAASGLCEGCFRTGEEIASWSRAGDDSKRGLWKTIVQRMAALQS